VSVMRRGFDCEEFPAGRVASAKRGQSVSVCIPARNEAHTLARIVGCIRSELMERHCVVDELVVVDDGSTDATAEAAERAGARVVSAPELLREYATGPGKGEAMWKGVAATAGDLVVFCDADVVNFDPRFVLGLLGPLVCKEDVDFVKGHYERPLEGSPSEGGRVTELMARPVLATFFPELSDLIQPLAGECAARRAVLEQVPFLGGYSVDVGLLIDVSNNFGNHRLVQCDLGQRVHRNRSLSELAPQALAVLQAVLVRAGVDHLCPGFGPRCDWTTWISPAAGQPEAVCLTELPPLAQIPAYRKSA